MKKILILALTLACMNTYASEYQVRYRIDAAQTTVVEKWTDLPTVYTAWVNSGIASNCTSRTPLENTVSLNTPFNQNFSGCQQPQTRTARTDQKGSLGTIKTGPIINENQILTNYSYTAQSLGTKPLETFTDLPTVYTAWANVGGPTNCTTKTPLENTIDNNTQFTQTLSGCTQQQSRTARTDQQGSYGTIKTGQVITENKTLTDYSYTTQATGTKPIADCDYSDTTSVASRWYDVAKQDIAPTNVGYGLQWKGTTISNTINSSRYIAKVTSFTSGGYVYTRGALKSSSEYNASLQLKYFYYYVCREAVK